jgi:biotin carboxylase
MRYCDLSSIDPIRKTISQLQKRALKICAIVSFIDPYCGSAARLAKEYELNHFTIDAIEKMQNKIISRNLIKNTSYAPKYQVIKADDALSLERTFDFPLVLKYSDSNGSKDVFFCEDRLKFEEHASHLSNKYPTADFLMEEYINGPQYLVETLVINKQVHIIAIIEQEIKYFNGHFIITGYQICLDLEDKFKEKLVKSVEELIEIHQLENGPCHLEMRIIDDEWKLIEINPRISGAGMNQLLEIGLGINLAKETLKFLLDQPLNLEPREQNQTFAEYGVIQHEGRLLRITGKNRAKKCEGVKHIYIKPRKGARLNPPTSLGDRYYFVIAIGKDRAEAKKNAKEAANQIEFHIMSKD